MPQRPIASGCATGGKLPAIAALLFFLASSNAAERWASCPDGSAVNTDTAFGAPHLAAYSGELNPELLQAASFVALTLPQQRAAVFDIVTRRLRANGVRFDPDEWLELTKHAINGVDSHAGARGLLYGLITGPFGGSYSPTTVPGIFRRNESGALFARDAVELDARECVLWPIVDKLIQSSCATTAGAALYRAARANLTAPRSCVQPPAQTQSAKLLLTDLRMSADGGLNVSIDKGSAKPGSRVRFRVWRVSAAASPGAAQQIWSGEATITSDRSDASLHAIVARGVNLATDPSRPFLRVDVDPVPGSQGPVSCEQPSGWEARHLDPELTGLHGPYSVSYVEEAVAGDPAVCIAFQQSKALAIWRATEFGFTVLRHKKTGSYYITPPVQSQTDLKVLTRDYGHSIDKAFERSCENKSDFTYAAEVHSHPAVQPPSTSGDFYSLRDFNRAIQLLQMPTGLLDESGQNLVTDVLGVRIELEKSILIDTRNRRVYWFKPEANDQRFQDVDGMDHVPTPQMFSEYALWKTYIDRSRAFTVQCVK
jgi:hypothetical protein